MKKIELKKIELKKSGFKKNKLEKTALLILIAFVLATGCKKQSKIAIQPNVETLDWQNAPQGQSANVTLYFVSKDGKKLLSEKREITYNLHNNDLQMLVIKELLAGPKNTATMQNVFSSPLLNQIELQSVEISGNTANVSFSQNYKTSLDEATRLKARAAIANTLIELTGAEYVNVFVDHFPIGYNNYNLGAMGWLELGLEDYLAQVKQENELSFNTTRKNITLYFPDVTNKYLLCETREVEVPDLFGVKDIILEELLFKGPQNLTNSKKLFKDISQRPTINEKLMEAVEDGMIYQIKTAIKQTPPKQEEQLVRAAVVCSLQSFFTQKGAQSVAVLFGDQGQVGRVVGEDEYFFKTEYTSLIGREISLYIPSEKGVLKTQSVVSQNEATNPQTILIKLFAKIKEDFDFSGEKEFDLEKTILGAKISKDVVIIDLSDAFYKDLSALQDEQKTKIVFSIVNSLTDLENVNKTMFLQNGKKVDSLFGKIDLSYPLLRNPGIIEQ